jgi:hypothetical protein
LQDIYFRVGEEASRCWLTLDEKLGGRKAWCGGKSKQQQGPNRNKPNLKKAYSAEINSRLMQQPHGLMLNLRARSPHSLNVA